MNARSEHNKAQRQTCKGPLLLFWFLTFPLLFFFYLIEQKRLKLALTGLLPCLVYTIAYLALIAAFANYPAELILPPWYLKTTIFSVIFWLIISAVLIVISKTGKSALATWTKSMIACTIIILISMPLTMTLDTAKAMAFKINLYYEYKNTNMLQKYTTSINNKIEGEIQLPQVSINSESDADDLLKIGDYIFHTGKVNKMSGNANLMVYHTDSYRVLINFYNMADPENPWPLNKINYTNDYDFYERMYNMTYSQIAKSRNYNEFVNLETLYAVKSSALIGKPIFTFENSHIKGFLREHNNEKTLAEVFSKDNRYIAILVLWSDDSDLSIEERKNLLLSVLATFRPADTFDETIVEKAANRRAEAIAEWEEIKSQLQ